MSLDICAPIISKKVGTTSTNERTTSDWILALIFSGHLTIKGALSPCSESPHFPEIPWSAA